MCVCWCMCIMRQPIHAIDFTGEIMPRVSVLMPAYNAEKYIAESIESILNQTFSDFEFIIINDGSHDNTAQIVKKYAAHDSRIKFVDNAHNSGVGVVRNMLLDMAVGEFVAYQDADDISFPHRLQTMVEFLDAHPDITVVGSALKTMPGNKIIKCPKCPKILDFYVANHIANPSVMFRRADINKHGIRYNPSYTTAEDYDFWTRVVQYFNVFNLDDALVHYREQTTSLSHNNPQMERNDKIIQSGVLNFLTSNPRLQMMLMPCHRIYLFGILPVFKIKRTRIYLFDFIPLVGLRGNWWYLFDVIPLYKQGA